MDASWSQAQLVPWLLGQNAYPLMMTLAQKLRQQINKPTDSEEAVLAVDLHEGLPPILDDEDEGLAETQRRDEELDRDLGVAISWEQLRREIGR